MPRHPRRTAESRSGATSTRPTSGAVFTIDANGKRERQLTHPPRGTVDDQPDRSPDGTRILFERCASGGLCRAATVRANGSDLRYLTPACRHGCYIRGPAYSPDGRKIALGVAAGPVKEFPGGGDQIETFTLVVMNVDGSGRQPVLQLGGYKGDLNYPQFSPDGTQLVFEPTRGSAARAAGEHSSSSTSTARG